MADEPPIDEEVTYTVSDGVARITVNRPDTGNSLSGFMRDRMSELFDLASADLTVRAVVLGAAGERHFCTGANLRGAQPPMPPKPAEAPERVAGEAARMIRRGWQRLVAAILDCEKPVIGAINGTAAGGGAQLVLACDLVVMADTARLIEVFVRRGIIPDAGGAYLLPRIVGLHKAKEIMFLGDDLSAADCERLGIANTVVSAAELGPTVDALAARLAVAPSKALWLTKWLLNRSSESSRQTAFDEEALAQDMNNGTEDAREGMLAFMERRETNFRGW